MAKNWTLKEAVQVLSEGTNKEDMMNIGGRFPLLAIAVSSCIAKAGKEFTDFMSYMPDYLTANKMHSMMKAGATTSEETDEETEVEEKVEKKAKAKVKAGKEIEPDEDGSYESMTAMELFKECKNRGIKAEAKKPAKFYIGLLEKDDKKKAKAEPEEEEDWGEDEEPEEKPAKAKKEKPAKEEKKKPAKKAEPEPEDTDDEDEDDDWDI